MGVEVLDYVSALKQGDIAKAAQLSFDCIQCGLCASRCMGELPQYHIAQLARRIYGKHLQPHAEHLVKRVAEIQAGKYDAMLDKLTKTDRAELEKLYKEREREPDMVRTGNLDAPGYAVSVMGTSKRCPPEEAMETVLILKRPVSS